MCKFFDSQDSLGPRYPFARVQPQEQSIGLLLAESKDLRRVVEVELINPQTGLGYLLSIAGRLQRSDEVFAGILTIGAVALLTDRALNWIRRRIISW